jgi:hypothetical protein
MLAMRDANKGANTLAAQHVSPLTVQDARPWRESANGTGRGCDPLAEPGPAGDPCEALQAHRRELARSPSQHAARQERTRPILKGRQNRQKTVLPPPVGFGSIGVSQKATVRPPRARRSTRRRRYATDN